MVEGNPVHDDIRAVVAAVGEVDFGLDVVLNREQRIVEAFGGSLPAMHAAAREASQRLAMQPVPALFDVVVTTNAGYPLDQNLYQAVKGMSAGHDGGQAGRHDRLRGGVPRRVPRPRLLPRGARLRGVPAGAARARSPRASARCPTSGRSRCRPRCRRTPTSSCARRTCPPTTSPPRHLGHTEDVAETVLEALHRGGPDSRVCVLPEGPQTIPYVR